MSAPALPAAVATTTRGWHVSLGAGLDGLVLREREVPEPGPGQALVRVHACSLSYRELMILGGAYPLPVRDDVVAVADGAGEVVAVGAGVHAVAPGDRVMAAVFPRWADGAFGLDVADQLGGSLDGLLTEYAVLDADALLPVPGHLSFEEAACLPCAGLTAWNAVHGGRGVRPGETVLTLGSGGVSLFALRFAALAGARVVATTSSEERAERLRALGADHVVLRAPGWGAEVRAVAGPVDLAVEVAAAFGETLAAMALGGEIAFVGTLGGEPLDPGVLFGAGVTVRPLAIGSRADLRRMSRAVTQHAVRPVIDRVFSFEEAPAALQHYASARPFGKVVIRVAG